MEILKDAVGFLGETKAGCMDENFGGRDGQEKVTLYKHLDLCRVLFLPVDFRGFPTV